MVKLRIFALIAILFALIEYATSKINEKVQENNNELAINGTSDLEVDSKDKDLDVSKNDIQNELEKREEDGKKRSKRGKCGKNNCDNSGDNVVVQQVQQEGNGFQFIFIPGNNEATTTTTCATTTEIESTTAGSLFFNVLEDDIIQ